MKNLYLLSFLAVVLSLTSCDQCKDVNCVNNGVCVEGECDCPVGFSGEVCELEDRCLSRMVDCKNGGECEDGDCECEEGFSGDECEDEDLCITEDPNCLNGGVCDDGDCNCPQGFTGSRCETLVGPSAQSLAGSWPSSDACSETGSALYTIVISSTGNSLVLSGIWGDAFDADINATLNGSTISIPLQDPDNDDYTIEGIGTVSQDNNTIDWDYTVSFPDFTQDDCVGQSTR